jgi:hyperosmotically inducible protein
MNPINDRPMSPIVVAAAVALTAAFALAACGERAAPTTKTTDVTPPQTAPAPAAPAADAAPAKTAEAAKPDPDAQLAAKVKSAFAGDPDLKMLPIDIRAANGAVTLYGTADNTKLRDKAVRMASGIEGVKSVSANVQIVRGS